MVRRLPATLIVSALLSGAGACAHRGPTPPVITSANSPTPKAALADHDLSRGGTESGTTEFALAGVTAALTGTLLVLGGLQVRRSLEIRDYCAMAWAFTPKECQTLIGGDPERAAKISAGLSFTLAVPITIASAFLLRRGLRIRRDALAWRRQNPTLSSLRLAPWTKHRGGGLALRFRF